MSLWAEWLSVIALALAALGTAWQAWISLGDFRKLQKALIRSQEKAFSQENHPSRKPKSPNELTRYVLFDAPGPISTAAWFTKSLRRFPRALALLKTTEENRADLVKFTRQAASWAILMVGSLCALAAALISLADLPLAVRLVERVMAMGPGSSSSSPPSSGP